MLGLKLDRVGLISEEKQEDILLDYLKEYRLEECEKRRNFQLFLKQLPVKTARMARFYLNLERIKINDCNQTEE